MTRVAKIVIWGAAGAAVIASVAIIFNRIRLPLVKSMTGAILRQDTDPRNQIPIAKAQVTVSDGSAASSVTSGESGLFRLNLPRGTREGDPITIAVRHEQYQPLDIAESAGDQIYVLRMAPVPRKPSNQVQPPETPIANIRIRYAVSATSIVNVGSAVKTFEVVNTGNVPCGNQTSCSPDGKWKAAIGGATLDAGDGNAFQGARVSCIAGPCPFTRIETDNFSRGGRKIEVSVRNWSDTASFLIEAEVIHPLVSDAIRQSYPVIFGRSMSFTLPPASQGPSIEAEVGGADIVFPLGPNLTLSWAKCSLQTASGGTKIYACELKDGYRFQ